MEMVLLRKWYKDTYTIGKLYLDGVYFCDTLEPKVRDYDHGEQKVKGKSAIPCGRYHVRQVHSPKRKIYVPQLDNVPMFEAIQIHPGNTAKDTAGCILVGMNKQKGAVLESKETFSALFARLIEVWQVHCDVYITIIND